MSCTSPIVGYQPLDGGSLKFGKEPPNHRSVTIACGQCADCRLKKSREWAIRCVHESQLHDRNCFITLTYSDDNLPPHGSLFKPHLQKFFKRLRKHYCSAAIRYYACGEYGDNTNRPHYHACLFGIDFEDKLHFRRIGEHNLYISQKLTDIWGHGQTSVGSLTFETAAYTARYVMKKTMGKGCKRYVRLDEESGELIPLVQPFAAMSLRPAIAKEWIEKYYADIYGADKDFLVWRTKKLKPPAYYDKIYDNIDNDRLSFLKAKRKTDAQPATSAQLRARAKNTHARLIARTQV
ncbi:MAG: replication initiator protein [Microviridae sp.]|nr:MAG: replication initiator protein [Microviridae sp.]